MPRDQVIAAAKKLLDDRTITEAAIEYLAQGFDVSDQAMEYRLINLGLRRQV